MEQSFGESFSGVRVHQGEHVRAIGARAFTQGDRVHFAPGQYRPDSPSGQELLGHELTHVVQQRRGRVSASSAAGVPINTDADLESEADQAGARAAAGQSVQVAGGAAQASLQGKLLPIQGRFYVILEPTERADDTEEWQRSRRYFPWPEEEGYAPAPLVKRKSRVEDQDEIALGRARDDWATFIAEFNDLMDDEDYQVHMLANDPDLFLARQGGQITLDAQYDYDDDALQDYLPLLHGPKAIDFRAASEVSLHEAEVSDRRRPVRHRVRPDDDDIVGLNWQSNPAALLQTLENLEEKASQARLRANVYEQLKHETVREVYRLYSGHLEYAYFRSGAVSDKVGMAQKLNKNTKKARSLITKRIAQLRSWQPRGDDWERLEACRNAELKWSLAILETLDMAKPRADVAKRDKKQNEERFMAMAKSAQKQIKRDEQYQERKAQFANALDAAQAQRQFLEGLVRESETNLAEMLWRRVYGEGDETSWEELSRRTELAGREQEKSRRERTEERAQSTYDDHTRYERQIDELIEEYGTGTYLEKYFKAQNVTAKILAQFAHEATGSRLLSTVPAAVYGTLIQQPAYREAFRKTRVGGSDVKLTLGFMLGDDNVAGIGLEAVFSGSMNIQDDRRFRVSGGFALNAKAQIGQKDLAQLKAAVTLFKGTYTKVYVDEMHWAANLSEQIAKAIVFVKGLRHHGSDPANMSAEELEQRASELGVYSKSQKEMLAYKDKAVTDVTSADFLAGASVSLSMADDFASIGGSVERQYWKFTKEVSDSDGNKRQVKTHGHQVVRQGSLTIGPVSIGAKYTKIYGHANPDNDGKYLNLSLGLPPLSIGRSGSTDGETGELSQEMTASVFGANFDTAAGDLGDGSLRDWVESAIPWDDFGGSFSEAFEHALNLEVNFVQQDSGKWAMQYLRVTPTSKYSVERGGGAGIASGSVGVEASTSAGIFEYLGGSTVTYFQTVYNGLTLRPEGEQQWDLYTRQHEGELRRYFNGVAKAGSKPRKELAGFDSPDAFIAACEEDRDKPNVKDIGRRLEAFNQLLAANRPKAAWTPSTRSSNRSDRWIKVKAPVRVGGVGVDVQNPIKLDDASAVDVWLQVDQGEAELTDFTTSLDKYLDADYSVVLEFGHGLSPMALFPSTWQEDAMGWFNDQFGADVFNEKAYRKLVKFARFNTSFKQFYRLVQDAYLEANERFAEMLVGGDGPVMGGLDAGNLPEKPIKAAKAVYEPDYAQEFAAAFGRFIRTPLGLQLPRPG